MQTIAECKARIREDEMIRRRLHNTIQELKGEMHTLCLLYIFKNMIGVIITTIFDSCIKSSDLVYNMCRQHSGVLSGAPFST